jgi:hypothetical protein
VSIFSSLDRYVTYARFGLGMLGECDGIGGSSTKLDAATAVLVCNLMAQRVWRAVLASDYTPGVSTRFAVTEVY